MGLFDIFKSKLSSEKAADVGVLPEDYKGYTITPSPLFESGSFKVSGTITKGEKSHTFIRADSIQNEEACAKETVRKAKLTIDEMGDGIFKRN